MNSVILTTSDIFSADDFAKYEKVTVLFHDAFGTLFYEYRYNPETNKVLFRSFEKEGNTKELAFSFEISKGVATKQINEHIHGTEREYKTVRAYPLSLHGYCTVNFRKML